MLPKSTFFTGSGVLFNYQQFGPYDFVLEDIALGLSKVDYLCGQHGYYSIGQHSTLTAKLSLLEGGYALPKLCLLEHASCAYFMRPNVDRHNPSYPYLERLAQDMIYTKFCGRAPNNEEQNVMRELNQRAEQRALYDLCPTTYRKFSEAPLIELAEPKELPEPSEYLKLLYEYFFAHALVHEVRETPAVFFDAAE